MALYQKGSIQSFFKGDPCLVSYVPLRETTIDYVRNVRGTPYNLSWKSEPLFPFKNGVAVFNGASSYVEMPPFDSSYVFNEITLLAWAQRLGNANQGDGKIIDLKYFTSRRAVLVVENPGNLTGLYFNVLTSSGNFLVTAGFSHTFYNAKPCLIVGVYDGNLIKLYIDGHLMNQTNASGSLFFGSSYYIGQEGGGGANRYFNGVITEVAVFSRALSAQEIKSYYKWATGQKRLFFVHQPFLNLQTSFSMTDSFTSKIKTTGSMITQFSTNAVVRRGIPRQLIKDIKTEEINFDIINQP